MPTNQRQWNSTLPQRKKGLQRTAFRRSDFKPGTSLTRKSKDAPKPAKKSSRNGSKKRGLGAGQKTREWKDARAKLKVVFAKAGITTCELRMEGCWRNNALGFAHSLKRRFIVTQDQLEEVALCCSSCHDKIEYIGHAEMEAAVKLVIEARSTPVETIFEKIEDGH